MSSISNVLLFIRKWFQNPSKVASITPSSKALAHLMTRSISNNTNYVLELGPGTGVFTDAIIKKGVKEENLILVEIESDFAEVLKRKFPKAKILTLDATNLKNQPSLPKVQTVICGLGFLNMASQTIKNIIESAFFHLKIDGEFFFFTYGPVCSIPEEILKELNLQAICIGKTYRNIPPATVYKITRQPSN